MSLQRCKALFETPCITSDTLAVKCPLHTFIKSFEFVKLFLKHFVVEKKRNLEGRCRSYNYLESQRHHNCQYNSF
jgi:hypothetical protein